MSGACRDGRGQADLRCPHCAAVRPQLSPSPVLAVVTLTVPQLWPPRQRVFTPRRFQAFDSMSAQPQRGQQDTSCLSALTWRAGPVSQA